MICPKCNQKHPTEDETGDYPGSAARVIYCPDVVMSPSDFGQENDKGDWVPKVPARARIGHLYRHVKTGGYYVVIAIGRNEATLDEVVVYKKYRTHNLQNTWVRRKNEFEDGRFEEIVL